MMQELLTVGSPNFVFHHQENITSIQHRSFGYRITGYEGSIDAIMGDRKRMPRVSFLTFRQIEKITSVSSMKHL